MELEWMNPQQVADRWGISTRRVQALCANGQILGVVRLGRAWLIPRDASKPIDRRINNGRKSANAEQEYPYEQ